MINKDTLSALIQILAENNIHCGIGGSYLLQLYELCQQPKDVDFWVDPADIEKLRVIFKDYEEIIEKIQLPAKFHFKIRFMDIEADFVACFITKPNQNEFIYNILPENVQNIKTSEGIILPCTKLEDWYIVYKLLGREEKAELIRKYIFQKDIQGTNELLEKNIRNSQNKLPKRVIKSVQEFMWDNMQLELDCIKPTEE